MTAQLHGEGKPRRVGSSPSVTSSPSAPSSQPASRRSCVFAWGLRATAGPQVAPCMWLAFPPGEPGRVSCVQMGKPGGHSRQGLAGSGRLGSLFSWVTLSVFPWAWEMCGQAGAVHSRPLGWHPGLAVAWYQLNHVCHESTHSAQRPWDEGAENLTQAL